ISGGQSVVLYSHRQRKSEGQYFGEILARFRAREVLRDKRVYAITFSKGTVRDYFMIAANEDHGERMRKAITNMENGLWGKLDVCRISIR
ncbi:MAG: hypothetical protein IKU27_04600, partial [Clostridia bacterium]|nr:hypothetical protein [Clostridia bacterium]